MASLRIKLGALAFAGAALTAASALAWGSTGHRMIAVLAVQALPDELPAFLRTPAAAEQAGELAREPDRWKSSGKVHDTDRDPAHFINLDDQGLTEAGMALDALPPTHGDYEAAAAAAGRDLSHLGYLPYALEDGFQQLAKDFAYWRVDKAAVRIATDPAHRAWFEKDAAAREQLILRDLGVFAHYVGDASQPLHVTVHYNGWGPGPNPDGFTDGRTTHADFEGAFVRANLQPTMVRARMVPFHDCRCELKERIRLYLLATHAQVEPFYRLEKAGGFVGGDRRGADFAAVRLAAGASELRDLIVLAWRESARVGVGYPQVTVNDVQAGRVDPFDALYGKD
jgi:hypothetical protein